MQLPPVNANASASSFLWTLRWGGTHRSCTSPPPDLCSHSMASHRSLCPTSPVERRLLGQTSQLKNASAQKRYMALQKACQFLSALSALGVMVESHSSALCFLL